MQGDQALVRVPVSGGELHCLIAGLRDSVRPALLLLHGWTLDHRMWTPQIAEFARERLVIAPDRRGFGRSTASPDVALEAEDALALLEHAGASCAVVVGMSQSGRVALDLALRAPERTAGLVLQGIRFGADDAPEIPVADYVALIRSGRIEDMKDLWRAHTFMRAATAEAQAVADAILDDYDGRDMCSDSPALPSFDKADVAKIAAPALIVTGAGDTPGRHRAAAALAAALPNAAKIEITHAGHLCNLDQPEAYNSALHRFLAAL